MHHEAHVFLTDKHESLAARAALACLAAAAIAALLPEAALESKLAPVILAPVAAVLLVAWLYLMALHIGRMLRNWQGYGLGRALAVLFIPFLGVIFVSLRRARSSA